MYVKEVNPWTWGRNAALRNRRPRLSPFPIFDTGFNKVFEDWVRDFDSAPKGPRLKEKGVFTPRLNLIENEKSFEVSVELPGIKEEDVQLFIEEGVLRVHGEKKSEHQEEKKNIYHVERRYGSFQRALTLPSGIDEEKIEATFDKGVLKIRLPKFEAAKKEVRKIPVKTA